MARQNGRTDQSRYSCKFGHLHHCTALRAVPASLHHYFRTTLYYICCHLVNRLHLRWTEGRGLIYEERGREGGLKRRNRANNRRNEPPLSFARIASDGAGEREGEREGEIGRKKTPPPPLFEIPLRSIGGPKRNWRRRQDEVGLLLCASRSMAELRRTVLRVELSRIYSGASLYFGRATPTQKSVVLFQYHN